MNAPFMQLYVGDYLKDTRHLTAEQHGAYLLLLMSMWAHGGDLPNDPRKLRRLAGCASGQWKKVAPEVLPYFQDRDGVLTSPLLDQWAADAAAKRPNLPLATRVFILERDGHVCAYCRDESGPFEVDHVHPVARGGSDDHENLVCSCRTCNRSKGSKTVSEWGGRA